MRLFTTTLALLCSLTILNSQTLISGGNNISAFLSANGDVYACGQNDMGIGANVVLGGLGTGNLVDDIVYIPERVVLEPDVQIKSVDAGSGSHFTALTCDGRVLVWGNNMFSQAGNTDYSNQQVITEPIYVMAGATNPSNPEVQLQGIVQIVGGINESYALTEDGQVLAWGQNDFGQLGRGFDSDFEMLPDYVVDVNGVPLINVIQITSGDRTSYALIDEDGDGAGVVYSWGDNTGGKLGQPLLDEQGYTNYAEIVSLQSGEILTEIVKVESGDVACFALDKKGNVWAWGNGGWGGVTGQGIALSHPDPRRVVGGETGLTFLKAKDIAGGQGFAMALTPEGNIVSWGNNGGAGGALGNGETLVSNKPVYVVDQMDEILGGVLNIEAGDIWGFATDTLNLIWTWGLNDVGQLGIATNQDYIDHAEIINLNFMSLFHDPIPFAQLGGDFETCANTILLNAGFPNVNENYGYTWYKDATIIGTSNLPEYEVTGYGDYAVHIEYIWDNAPCGIADATDEITITEPMPEYVIPQNLTFCPPFAEVHVEGEGSYSIFSNSNLTDTLGQTSGNDTLLIATHHIHDRVADIYSVYVEENAGKFGMVVPQDSLPESTNRTTQEYNTGFAVYRDIILDSVSFIVSPFSMSAEPDEWQIQIYGGGNLNGQSVADRTHVIAESEPFLAMADTTCISVCPGCNPQCQSLPTKISIPIDILLSGEEVGKQYWIGIKDFHEPVIVYEINKHTFYDNIDSATLTVLSTDIQRNPSPRFGPLFDWHFHTPSKACAAERIDLTFGSCSGDLEISLREGWNFVAIPFQVEYPSIDSVFPTASVVKKEDSITLSARPSYLNTLQEVYEGGAYLVHSEHDTTYRVTGVLEPKETINKIQLKAGWNYVGIPAIQGVRIPTESPEILEIKNFEEFYIPGNGLSTIDFLESGKGYFVKVSEDYVLRFWE